MPTEPQLEQFVDLPSVARAATGSGPDWSYESVDLDVTLLTWAEQDHIVAHLNDEVDVLLIGITGGGEVTINGNVYRLSSGHLLLIPKQAERSLRCTEERWSYLSVHQRRRGLWPTIGTKVPKL